MDTAKVFMTGDSQVVLLPAAYHFDTDEVTIERAPDGAVVLRSKPKLDLGKRVRSALEQAGDTSDFERPDQGTPERDAAWWDERDEPPRR